MIWILRKVVVIVINVGLLVAVWHYRHPIEHALARVIDYANR